MRRINVLINDWFKEICKGDHKEYIFKEKHIQKDTKHMYIFSFLTIANEYQIAATENENSEGHLYCVMFNRKRSKDMGIILVSGYFTKETWEEIKTKIMKNEVINLER